MEKLISGLIRNVTGKTFTYKDNFPSSTGEHWFMDATFDGKMYRVITFCEDGVIRLYGKHPLDQRKPTHSIKLKTDLPYIRT